MKIKLFIFYTIIIAFFIIGILTGYFRGIPFIAYPPLYAIGIYSGENPFTLSPDNSAHNPVITAKDVTDIQASFVADPFMINENNKWYMFFEVLNQKTNQGDIGLAISDDALSWNYQKIVLDEPYHLSYPFVFKHNNEMYLIPESSANYEIRLYKAKTFPTEWELEKVLLTGNYVDPTIFQHNNHWWMFAGERHDILHLFYADDLKGEWKKHPLSPLIVKDGNISRPSGRVILYNNNLYRFTQDCTPEYGMLVRAFKIEELSKTTYRESAVKENPVIYPIGGSGWNSRNMHHIDAHTINDNWIACVDGIGPYLQFGLNL